MLDFISDNARPLLWGLGIFYLVLIPILWSCLAMSKRCEEG